MIALVGAMFVVMQPASAHDLGTCSDPEYLTQAACIAVVGDDPETEAVETTHVLNTWTPGTHTAANHPPTLSITVLDSDGIVPDDTTIRVLISVSGVHTEEPRTGNPLVAAEASTFPTLTLDYLRVSGELEGPNDAPSLSQTGNGDDDNTAGAAIGMIVIPAGTTAKDYTVSTRLTPRTGDDSVLRLQRQQVRHEDGAEQLSQLETPVSGCPRRH